MCGVNNLLVIKLKTTMSYELPSFLVRNQTTTSREEYWGCSYRRKKASMCTSNILTKNDGTLT